MNYSNYFIALLIGYNRTASNFASKIPTWIAVISLVMYHLQRAGTFLFSTEDTIPSLGTTVNRAMTQVIKMFQIQYWTQITPLNYEGITIILFSIIVLGVLVKVRFLILVRTRERLSNLFQLVFISWTLVFEKYFLYIPVLENSFYVLSTRSQTLYTCLCNIQSHMHIDLSGLAKHFSFLEFLYEFEVYFKRNRCRGDRHHWIRDHAGN